MRTPPILHPTGAAAYIIVATILAATLAGCSGDDDNTAATPATAPFGSAVLSDDPAGARSTVVAAIGQLRTEPIETTATGVAGDQSIEIGAAADATTGAMRFDEVLNDTIRTLFVLDDGLLFANIFPISEDQPPFTVTDPGEDSGEFFDKAFTASGRIFGKVDTLVAVLERVPATVYELGTRDGDDDDQRGFRFVFDAADIGKFLEDEGLERVVLIHEPGEDETVIEVWLDERLRELRTAGSMYQDGELIDDVEVTIGFRPVDDADIEAPTDTLAR